MTSINDMLSCPVSGYVWDRENEEKRKQLQAQLVPASSLVTTTKVAPPYLHRKGWLPRTQEDFGDGGAYPECTVVQYPLDMGKKGGSAGGSGNALAMQLDQKGEVKYDAIAKQGHHKDKIVYTSLKDMTATGIKDMDDPELRRPDKETIDEITEKTRLALEKLTRKKVDAAMPVRCAEKQAPAQYLRYTPGQQGSAYNSGAQQRVIRMMDTQVDPMEPPRFNISKKVPRGPPSPPAPVLHSPTRKVTVKEQQEWRIPPCVSNWKNPKGYTLPLDKRLAADGRGLQSVHINEKFAKLAEALYIADRKAREQVDMRSQLEKMAAQKEKHRKEESLKNLAKKAREEQGGVRASANVGGSEEEAARERLRTDRARERKRDAALQERRGGTNRERDITEQVALGLPQKTSSGGEAQFDQRLFNQSRGMDSGFGDDEAYGVYDKPWRNAGSMGNALYKAPSQSHQDFSDMDDIMNTRRFVADKSFSGADNGDVRRSGPVEFEARQAADNDKEEEDLFGVIGLLSEAKKASKRNEHFDHDGGESRKRRRN